MIRNLEKKFGRYAIPNLSAIMIALYAAGYLLWIGMPQILNYCTLDPGLILKGQVWRLISWIVIPPSALNIFTVIMLFFYYSIGKVLEQTWGNFRYNMYIFSGILFTVIGAFILYFIFGEETMHYYSIVFSTYYINMSIFLAFASSYPDMTVLLYFVIPLKMKWLGMIYAAMLIRQIIISGTVTRVVIIVSLLNFLLYFFCFRDKRMWQSAKRQKAFQQSYQSGMKNRGEKQQTFHRAGSAAVIRHKCAICGRTDQDDPTLEFRFCSKCDGNLEYCNEHLFTHQHVHNDQKEGM